MNKKILAAVVCAATVLSLAGCGDKNTSSTANNNNSSTPANNSSTGGDNSTPGNTGDNSTPVDDFVVDKEHPQKIDTGITPSDSEGKVINIWAWNDEFKGFFEKYYKVPDGYTVKWTINPSDDGVYQQKLDEALFAQDSAAADDKIDIYLAEADYILKYVDSEYSKDVSEIGFSNASTIYNYTAEAVTDSNGKQKGMSFQCCPAGLIYRRSIAKEVIGSDDPATVQDALSSWEKFDSVAQKANEKGYMMTGSFAATYRTFSNNTKGKWVQGGNVVVDDNIKTWIKQAKSYSENGYTNPNAGVWSDAMTNEMYNDGKVLCYFGPAWYYNFSMGGVKDAQDDGSFGPRNSMGDWGLIVGPQSYFWGGTWLLVGPQTDNPEIVKDIMDAFQSNEKILKQMVEIDSQFVNNSAINDIYAAKSDFGSELLGGQNDWAIFANGAKSISLKNATGYDQLLNEGLQNNVQDYFIGTVDFDTAWGNFVKYVRETYPELTIADTLSLD